MLMEEWRVVWNILGLNRMGLQETGGNHIMRSIMIYTAHQMFLGCNILRECDGQGM